MHLFSKSKKKKASYNSNLTWLTNKQCDLNNHEQKAQFHILRHIQGELKHLLTLTPKYILVGYMALVEDLVIALLMMVPQTSKYKLKCITMTQCQNKGERKKFLKNDSLTSYEIIFDQKTFFSIIKLVFLGKHECYLFYYNVIFKDRVLFK